jgi:cell fate regulator YaaT (PSP1 superfamily)
MTDDAAITAPAPAPAPPALPPAAPPGAHLIEVTFKGNRREFFTWAFPDPPALRTRVIVDADRGEDLGVVHATGDLAAVRKAGTTHGKASPDQLRAALRAATADDIARAAQLRTDEDNVRRRAIEKVRAQGLDMKVSDTEWQWDRKKLTIYFTAEKRVDFRQLVRQLEGLFGTRVQMWHIGVRDEARRLDGVGRCARRFCSASWLPELRPVKSSVAKDQRLSTLNPSQISGSCGRLMCCLRYEHEFYVQQRKRFPKEGRVVVTAAGEEKVVANDIFREQVALRGATGDMRVVPLAQLNRELGGEPVTAASDLATSDDEPEFEEEVTTEVYLVDPPRGADTRTYPGPAAAARHAAPRAAQQAAGAPGAPGAPRAPGAPGAPGSPGAPDGAGSAAAPGGRRRRRRGRRGGRRGRDGGGPPDAGGSPAPGDGPAPAPPAPRS